MTAQGELRKEIENQKELYWLQHSKENKKSVRDWSTAAGVLCEAKYGAIAEVRKARRQRS